MSSSNQVPSISNAPESLAEDQARRTKRYLIQMGIRLVCFLGAVIVHGWFSFVLIGAAIVLPYVAVLLVNAGRDQKTYDVSPMERLQVESAPDHPSLGRVVELDDEGQVREDAPTTQDAADAAPDQTPGRTRDQAAEPTTRPTTDRTDRTTDQEPHDG
ncbi:MULTISPECIES: DUF3099 domain-containing protein [Oerskovia]|uniref:DUF3099 domain-containing protein n=1 Tax=Oerskovia paurometabola TaxID=162170 RepID=A0ABW1XB63_9CELL|nr:MULTISPECIES: DUF3099 domain-containing protein [Oerskovia]MBM7497167.1 cell division protein FtsN [Oerskovia paurometabola]